MKIIKKIIFLSALILTLSCSRVEKSGYSFELTDYKIQEGSSSKIDILRNMGSPTLVDDIDGGESWIYMEEEVRHLLFFRPKIQKRKVILISFDNKNIVKTLNSYDISNENAIKFSENKTAVTEIKKGFFADIFGNIGQVRAQ